MKKLRQLYKRIVVEESVPSNSEGSILEKMNSLMDEYKMIYLKKDKNDNKLYLICDDVIESSKRTIKTKGNIFQILKRKYVFKSLSSEDYNDIFNEEDFANKTKIKSVNETTVKIKVCCTDNNETLNKILNRFNVKPEQEELEWNYEDKVSIFLVNNIELVLTASQHGYSSVKCDDRVLTEIYESAIAHSVTRNVVVDSKEKFLDLMKDDFSSLKDRDLYMDTCWGSYGYTIQTVPTSIKEEILGGDSENYICVRHDMSSAHDFSNDNPTDVWLINKDISETQVLREYGIKGFDDPNPFTVISTIVSVIGEYDKDKRPEMFNKLFDEKLLIGISLKKVENRGGNLPEVSLNGFNIEVPIEDGFIKKPDYNLNKKGNCNIKMGDFFLDIRVKASSAGIEARSKGAAARAGKGNIIIKQHFNEIGFNYRDNGSLKNPLKDILTSKHLSNFNKIILDNSDFEFLDYSQSKDNETLSEEQIEHLMNEKSDDPKDSKLKLFLLVIYLIESHIDPPKFAYQILGQITKSNCVIEDENMDIEDRNVYTQPYFYYLIH